MVIRSEVNIVLAHAADISKPSGGTERVSAFASGLQAAGHDVTLVVPRPADPIPERLAGIDISAIPINHQGVVSQPIRGGLIVRRAHRLAEEQGAMLQIEHSPLGGLAALLGCEQYVLDMHDLAFPSPLYGDLPAGGAIQQTVKAIEKRGLKNAAKIIVVSDQMRELVRESWDIPTDRFITIPNGHFTGIEKPFADVSSVPGRVVFLGSLHPKLSVDAFSAICDVSEVSELIVVGDGAKRSELESIENSKLQVTGHLPDQEAFELVASAAVAINPQRVSRLQQASSPVKLYYYSALGVPMVLTEGPDAVDLLETRGAAIAVPENGDFAAEVQRVLTDDGLREEMRNASMNAAVEFRWEARVKTLLDVYAGIVNE